jgi:hypothetical protein
MLRRYYGVAWGPSLWLASAKILTKFYLLFVRGSSNIDRVAVRDQYVTQSRLQCHFYRDQFSSKWKHETQYCVYVQSHS